MGGNVKDRDRPREELARELEELRRQAAERTADLRVADTELARASRLTDEFLAGMSHELRTPLTAILGMSEALQGEVFGTLNEQQLVYVRTIEESGRLLLALINDILDISRIEAGKLALCISSVPVSALCKATLALVRQAAEEKRLTLSCSIDETLTTVEADERRLQQMLVNLFNNAIKFTPEGGEVGLDVTRDGVREAVDLTVWDTGVGIPREDMARLFKPFTQLDGSLSRQHPGTGMGLALVFRLTEQHGGGVALESEVGKGSRFTVSLPWREGGRDQGSGVRDQGAGITVLVAEDNEVSIGILSGYLSGMGCRVVVARDGLEAIRVTNEEKPDVILMDVQMPKVDGLEAIQLVRGNADPDLAAVPIVAVTGLTVPGDRERCLAAGADAYLSKPIGRRQLEDAIEGRVSGIGD
jgi:signal transduction histidine kinase/ActR/RegA family two-component response regulator